MNPYKINQASLIEIPNKTTPQNVREAHEALFRSKMTLPAAAKHCGMTQKELKMTFYEYLKYNRPDWDSLESGTPLIKDPELSAIINEIQGEL